MKPSPIPEIARDLLEYDPKTGRLWWKEYRNGNCLAGTEAGWTEKGRRRVEIDHKIYLVHRVAYFLHTGEQPPHFLDHKDGDAMNNSFANLRVATRRQNNRNKGVYSNNTTGSKGVTYCAESGKYRARAGLNGRKVHLGRYDTIEEASKAYEEFTKRAYGDYFRPV
ncbi:HNH endonuclease [Ochrobactrum intermedium]|uniref:HNH endonuclease n=1 Tax=Brucella intermedia TaxID=94625 RepID=UPI00159C519E|nr:HNH endonuclease [Brucella intermedia]NVM41930.1 HNH endonuclease [Brucella intermedia]